MTGDNRPVTVGSRRYRAGQVWIVREGKRDVMYAILATDRATRRVLIWDGCTRREDAEWREAEYLTGARKAIPRVGAMG